jgi:hypothetical protein
MNDLQPPPRIVPNRQDSHPLDSFLEFDDASGPASNETDQPPSLVSQLQQVHGLVKKNVYGTRPPWQPFFREERVRDKYRKPTPLTMPSSVIEDSPSAGGKVVSQSRADRMSRVGQASPTDLHSRRQKPWPRRGSRLSTPGPESMSSPSNVYDLSPGSSYSSDMSAAALPIYQIGVMPEQNWPPQAHYQSEYHSVPQQQYFPSQISNFYNTTGQVIEHADVQALEQRPATGLPSSHPPTYSNYATPMLTPPIVSPQSYPINDTPITQPQCLHHLSYLLSPTR